MIVLLYVMDALRPDFLGCYGFGKNTSQNIDSFAKDSVLFENAYSTASWTQPAAASLLTSQFPRTLGVMNQFDMFPKYDQTLQNILREGGFKTIAISANPWISPQFGISHFHRFESLSEVDEIIEKRRTHPIEHSKHGIDLLNKLGLNRLVVPLSEDINQVVFNIIDESEDENIFFLCWSMDTHGPYFVRGDKSEFGNSITDFISSQEFQKYRGKKEVEKLKSLYYDMIYYNDQGFGKLISKLKEEGLYDDAMIILLSDHGEVFGEHAKRKPIRKYPNLGHGGAPYEEAIRIPLIIKFSGNKFKGYKDSSLVQITDVLPTILDEAGIDMPTSDFEGRSLLSKKDNTSDGIIYTECQFRNNSPKSSSIRIGDWKLIKVDIPGYSGPLIKKIKFRIYHKLFTKKIKIFNLINDMHEVNDLNSKESSEKELLLKTYDLTKKKCDEKRESINENPGEVEDKIRKRLASLGYMD